jgi:hypothetical protein
MKIEQQGYTGSASGPGRATGASSVGYSQLRNSGGFSVEDSGDHADVSGVARMFQMAQGARSEQVENLGSLVRSGGYSIDPAAISRSLVAETIAAQGAVE